MKKLLSCFAICLVLTCIALFGTGCSEKKEQVVAIWSADGDLLDRYEIYPGRGDTFKIKKIKNDYIEIIHNGKTVIWMNAIICIKDAD